MQPAELLIIAGIAIGILITSGFRFARRFSERARIDRRLEKIERDSYARREAGRKALSRLDAVVDRTRKVRVESDRTLKLMESKSIDAPRRD